MKKEVLISMIMPTYNRGYCICKAIDSLLRQKGSDYELIIVDDGSSDGTKELVRDKYSWQIEQGIIVYVEIKHKGAAVARNVGLKKAKGEWIGYLDSDNEMSENFLQLYRSELKKHPQCKIFYAKMQRIESGEIVGHKFDRDLLLKQNYIDMGTIIHHRECVVKCGNFDEKLKRFIDYELILRYTQEYQPIFIDEVVLKYDDSGDKNRITNTEKFDKARKYIAKKYGIVDYRRSDCLTFRGKLLLLLLKIGKLLKLLSKEEFLKKRDLAMIENSTLFDEKWYIKNAKINSVGAAEHYLQYGWKKGLNPSAKFDGNDYLKRYSDVAKKNKNPLLHYLQNGVREGRIFFSCESKNN